MFDLGPTLFMKDNAVTAPEQKMATVLKPPEPKKLSEGGSLPLHYNLPLQMKPQKQQTLLPSSPRANDIDAIMQKYRSICDTLDQDLKSAAAKIKKQQEEEQRRLADFERIRAEAELSNVNEIYSNEVTLKQNQTNEELTGFLTHQNSTEQKPKSNK